MQMLIKLQTEVTPELVSAFEKLIPQLSANSQPPTFEELENIIWTPETYLFTAEDNGRIVGSLTLVTYRIPTGRKAWIEDVVVDEQLRGRRVGEMLVQHAIGFTRDLGITKLDLTSTPSRLAANHLYRKLGFLLRDTNVYRFVFK